MALTDSDIFNSTLEEGANTLGIPLAPEQVQSFARLAGWLLEWNERMNLTAVRDPADIAVKHILDSLTCLRARPFPQDARVLDVGTGAGFPGLALKIARPDLCLSLLDSTRKKLSFVEFVTEQMGWTDVEVLSGRAEEIGNDPAHREQYNVVVARAVAAMRILSEFCLPFARVGGVFLAMKGPNVDEEIPAALSSIDRLGGEAEEMVPFSLPFGGGERAIVPIAKVRPTPAGYPRIYREMKRHPL